MTAGTPKLRVEGATKAFGEDLALDDELAALHAGAALAED